MKPAKFSVGDSVEFNTDQETLGFLQTMMGHLNAIQLREVFFVEQVQYYQATDQWMILIGSNIWTEETWVSEKLFRHATPAVPPASH